MAREKTVVISLRVTPGLKEAVDKAAERSGLGQMDWIRAVLADAANAGAFGPPQRAHVTLAEPGPVRRRNRRGERGSRKRPQKRS